MSEHAQQQQPQLSVMGGGSAAAPVLNHSTTPTTTTLDLCDIAITFDDVDINNYDNTTATTTTPATTTTTSTTDMIRTTTTTTHHRYTLWASQFLLLVSNLLAVAATQDCQLFTVPLDRVVVVVTTAANETTTTVTNNNDRLGLGLFTWERDDGRCMYTIRENDLPFNSNYIVALRTIYGDHAWEPLWGTASVTAVASLISSWIFWIWLMSFTCYEYNNIVRCVLSFALIFIIPCSRVPVFFVEQSSICQEYACTLGPCAHMFGAAIVASMVSGVLLLCTKEDPIKQLDQRHRHEQRVRRQQLRRLRQQRRYLPQNESAVTTSIGFICTLQEEERRRDGLNNAREVPVDINIVDPALLGSTNPCPCSPPPPPPNVPPA